MPTQPDSIYDQTKFPVQSIQPQQQQQLPVNRPITQNQVFVTPRPPQPSYYSPPQQQQQQNQVVYYSQPTQLSPQQVFVTQPTPPNYVEITPKPHYSISSSYGNNRVPTSTQLPLSAVAPFNFITTPQQSNPPQILWTNDRNHYQHGFSTTTPSSLVY